MNRQPPVLRKHWWQSLGPGIITGAADDDPSGIATYSQAGAKFGFDTLWTIPFTYPLMSAIQMISARIGVATGHGIATHVRNLYPAWVLWSLVLALCVANTINIGADIAAMGDASALLLGGSSRFYAVALGIISLMLQILVPYRRYVKILKWLTLAVFAYIAALFAQPIDWRGVFSSVVHPTWRWHSDYITMIVAIFGTTISPYLFFWQSSEEVEDLRYRYEKPARESSRTQNRQRFSDIRNDTLMGMAISNIVAFAIMICTAVGLHAHGVTRIQTSADAARALEPFAGKGAFIFFTLGIIGTGLLAVPVLAGSCAYAVAGARSSMKASLEHSFSDAPAFYMVIAVASAIGMILCFVPINPMDALYWSAVVNGVVAVPLIGILMRIACNARVMGAYRLSLSLRCLGWLTFIIMALSAIAMWFGQ